MKIKQYSLYTGAAVFLVLALISSKNPLVSPSPVYQGMDIDISPVVEFANLEEDKTYLLFVYSMGCPSCWNSVDAIKAFQDSDQVDEVIGITFGRRVQLEEFTERFDLNFTSYLVNRGLIQQLTNVFPGTYLVKNNLVVDDLGYPVPTPVEYTAQVQE